MRDYSTNQFRFGKYDVSKPHNREQNFYKVLRDDPGYAKWCLSQYSRYPQMNVWRTYIHLRQRFAQYVMAEGLLSHMGHPAGSYLDNFRQEEGLSFWSHDDPSDRDDGDPAITHPTATVLDARGAGH